MKGDKIYNDDDDDDDDDDNAGLLLHKFAICHICVSCMI